MRVDSKLIIVLFVAFIMQSNVDAEDVLSPVDAIKKDIASEYRARPYPTAADVLNGEIDKKLPPSPLYPKNVEPVLEGFSAQRLSEVPAPDVHPRILMSPSDIDMMRRYVALGDAAPPAFQVAFSGLKSSAAKDGDRYYEQAPWVGPTTGLGCKALLALITEDKVMGRECVPVILDHADALLADLDMWYATEFENAPEWVQKEVSHDQMYMAPRSHCFSLAMEYDYAYDFMTEEERAKVRDAIAKYTAGKYTSFMEMPDHFLINNHWGFAMNWWVGSLAIEGEQGWDPRVGEIGQKKVTAYVTSSLSPDGMMFEGQKPNLPPYAILAAARRGPRTLAMHPHLHAYAEMAANSIRWTGNDDGVWRLGRVGYEGLGDEVRVFPDTMMKYFYPDNELINLVWRLKSPSSAYGFKSNGNHSGSGHGGLDLGMLYSMGAINEDERVVNLEQDGLPEDIIENVPLTWYDALRGALRTRSGWSKDDIMLWFENKADYFSAGHEVAEHNNFLFASHGIEWTPYAGRYQAAKNQNMIIIDGLSAPRWNPVPGNIPEVTDSEAGTAICGEATDGYNWIKGGKILESWHPALGVKGWDWIKGAGMGNARDWEWPFQPQLRAFNEGFAHLDWGNWHGEIRGPEYTAQWNQVEKVIRTVQLARGKHPYMLVIDDVKKDDQIHMFDWVMNMNRKAFLVSAEKDDLILGMPDSDAQLLVRVLYRNEQEQTLPPSFTQRKVMVSAAAVEPEFRILLYPHRKGEVLPQTRWSSDRARLHIDFADEKDTYHFGVAAPGRTVFELERDGKSVMTTAGQPLMPKLKNVEKWYGLDCVGIGGHRASTPDELRDNVFPFVDKTLVQLQDPVPGTVIRYTTDLSEPTQKSALYEGAIPISKTTTFKFRTFSRNWRFGDDTSSVNTMKFVREVPVKADREVSPETGLLSCEIFEVFQTIYEEDGFFSGKKNMMPEFLREYWSESGRESLLHVLTAGLEVPRIQPVYEPRRQTKGFYRYQGYFYAEESGLHHFKLHAPGPVRLTVGDKDVINHSGQYYLGQRDRFGVVALEAGWHKFEMIFCDPSFFKGRFLAVFKDYGHGGSVPISITYERDLEPSLAVLAPGEKEYNTVEASSFGVLDADVPVFAPKQSVNKIPFVGLDIDPEAGVSLRKFDRSLVVDESSDGFLEYDGELLDVGELEPFSEDVVLSLSDNNSNKSMELHEYSGMFYAPSTGIYKFQTDRAGINELVIHDTVVQNNRITGEWPCGGVILETGWHPLSLRLFRSDAILKVKRPRMDNFQQISINDLGQNGM